MNSDLVAFGILVTLILTVWVIVLRAILDKMQAKIETSAAVALKATILLTRRRKVHLDNELILEAGKYKLNSYTDDESSEIVVELLGPFL